MLHLWAFLHPASLLPTVQQPNWSVLSILPIDFSSNRNQSHCRGQEEAIPFGFCLMAKVNWLSYLSLCSRLFLNLYTASATLLWLLLFPPSVSLAYFKHCQKTWTTLKLIYVPTAKLSELKEDAIEGKEDIRMWVIALGSWSSEASFISE